MVTTADLVVVIVLFGALFGGSTYLAAIPLRREVRRSVERGEPLPRIANWWRLVVSRAWWIVGAAAVLTAGAAFAWSRGAQEGAGYALLLALGLVAYLAQAAYLVRVVNRTIERTTKS